MKNKDFVMLCLRLLGIYFGVIGLSSLANMGLSFIDSGQHLPFFFVTGPMVQFISGLVLYFSAPAMSNFIVQFSNEEKENVIITTSEKTTRIALLVLGVYIFVTALPQLIHTSINVALYYKELSKFKVINEIPDYLTGSRNNWLTLLGPSIKVMLSAVLIIGPDQIIGILSKYDATFRRINKTGNKNPK